MKLTEIKNKALNGLDCLTDQELKFLISKDIGNTNKFDAYLNNWNKRKILETYNKYKISSSKSAFEYLCFLGLHLQTEEHFYCLVLNRKNEVLTHIVVGKGGVTSTVVDMKVLFRKFLEVERACAIFVAHNHPSGNITPSQHDIDITAQIKKSCKILHIAFIDHVIVGNNQKEYFSFADEGVNV